MDIVHICFTTTYVDGLGYQENILAKKHFELGLKTYILSFSTQYPLGYECTSAGGIHIIYLPMNKHYPIIAAGRLDIFKRLYSNKLCRVYQTIERLAPEIIFIHGPQSLDNLAICRYKKHNPNVKVYCDNHGDFYNMPVAPFSNGLIQKVYYRYIAKKIESVSEKMWGVTPWRVDYLQKVYGIKSKHTELLVMGGDEKLIDFEHKEQVREQIRNYYHIPQNDFLVVTGGKIDKTKNIHHLVEAINDNYFSDVSLLIFGKINEDMDSLKNAISSNPKIYYAGWLDSNKVYPLFLASDLAVFPGTHSVLWEQACASGIPCVFKDWGDKMHHVDVGGNAVFIDEVSSESLRDTIERLSAPNSNDYKAMSKVAEEKARKEFAYIEIAKKAIGIDR